MASVVPVLLVRKRHIVLKLSRAGAVSPETARTLAQAGVTNPWAFPRITQAMVRQGILGQVEDRYYVNQSDAGDRR